MRKSVHNSLFSNDAWQHEYASPNNKYKLVLSGTLLGGKAVLVYDQQSYLIWRFPHSIYHEWNRDCSYLAIGGNVAADEPGYVIVVSLRKPGHPAFIYQTPYSASNAKISFDIKRWGHNNDLYIDVYNEHRVISTFVEDMNHRQYRSEQAPDEGVPTVFAYDKDYELKQPIRVA